MLYLLHNITAFVLNPMLTHFDKCKKSDLHELAEHFDIPGGAKFPGWLN